MKRLTLATALCLIAAPAFAFHCPADMKQIDAALASGTSLSSSDLTKVQSLRAEGEKLHRAGQHQQSVDTLQRAKVLLGLK